MRSRAADQPCIGFHPVPPQPHRPGQVTQRRTTVSWRAALAALGRRTPSISSAPTLPLRVPGPNFSDETHTHTPETTARTIRGLFDVRDATRPLARMNMPEDFVFLSRHQLAVLSVCVGLRATMHSRATFDDIEGVAEPITELGKERHAWVRERGLPSALDHHDHP